MQMASPASVILRLIFQKGFVPSVQSLSLIIIHSAKAEIGTHLVSNHLSKTINGGGRKPVFNDNLRLNVCNVDSSLKWFVQLSIAYIGVMPDVTAISAMPGFGMQSQIRFPLSTYRQ
ncbi:hypothetical protein KIW84_062695 [Lathyrus oleraceus]|uniref:C2 domain-containing protein n=1 Tax=Pisum sativum TaxID=3888 RepID=A0A9D4W5U7_PEA|nr:hypothetical protein KIW84_062695 [Pisum sativum]